MNIFHVCKKLKSFSLVILSVVILICSVPTFSIKSEAASTMALQQSILYLTSYFASKGYSIAHKHGSSLPTVQELLELNMDRQGQFLNDIAIRLDTFGATHDVPDLGEQFINAIKAACFTGALILSPTVRDLVDLWAYTNTASGSLTVGTTYASFSDFAKPANFNYTWRITYGSSGYASFNGPSVFVRRSSGNSGHFYPESISQFTFNVMTNKYYFLPTSGDYYTQEFNYDGKTYVLARGNQGSDVTANFSAYQVPTYNDNPSVAQIFNLYMQGLLGNVADGDLVFTQITDTSSTDVLTSSNEIDSDGTVMGPSTYYLPDYTALVELINQYNQGVLDYANYIQSLGLAQVSNSATTTEKEDALASVAYPDSTYDWLTRTAWGEAAITESTSSLSDTKTEEKSIADSVANTMKGDNNQEDNNKKSRGKGLLAALLLALGWWNTPIIAGDGSDSDSGGTDDGSGGSSHPTYLADTISGMAIAGGLVDDFFSAAGGSDGYGFIYTVGASFVIFSVVIGAANYFGALFHGQDTKQNVKPSGKQKSAEPKGNKGK